MLCRRVVTGGDGAEPADDAPPSSSTFGWQCGKLTGVGGSTSFGGLGGPVGAGTREAKVKRSIEKFGGEGIRKRTLRRGG